MAHVVVELAAVHVERGPPFERDQGVGERQRRVGDIRPANIECPGDVLRVGNEQCVGAQARHFRTDTLEFVGRAFAGELEFAQSDGPGRRRRPVAPQRVDWIVVDRDQLRARGGAGSFQLFSLVACVQPRVVTDFGASVQILLKPLIERTLDQVLDRKNSAINLASACTV